MKDVTNFFEENFPKDTDFVFPQIERAGDLHFEYVPNNEAEFYAIVDKAPLEILHGFGFMVWDTVNAIILDNNKKSIEEVVSYPIANARRNAPTQLLDVDEDIIFFPVKWYGIIPDGFVVTGLYAQQFAFRKGFTDDEERFGCLAYGIRRKKIKQ